MEQNKKVTRWLIVATSINLAIVLTLAVIVGGLVSNEKSVTENGNGSVIVLSVPNARSDTSDATMTLPLRSFMIDNSEFKCTNLLNFEAKNKTVEYAKYVKEIKISEYATFEDILIQFCDNTLQELSRKGATSYSMSLPLTWYNFYDEYDFTTINVERLKFKCEMVAQKWGMTTYGKIYYDGKEYFTINFYTP